MEGTNKNKKNVWKVIVGVAALVALIAAFLWVYTMYKEKPVEGTKSIVIEVVNKEGETTEYPLQTDAQFLLEAMREAEALGFSFVGKEDVYGVVVSEVNGETADFNVDNAYWSFNVNGEYCNYGISEQPVEDGDRFSIVYTVYAAE